MNIYQTGTSEQELRRRRNAFALTAETLGIVPHQVHAAKVALDTGDTDRCLRAIEVELPGLPKKPVALLADDGYDS